MAVTQGGKKKLNHNGVIFLGIKTWFLFLKRQGWQKFSLAFSKTYADSMVIDTVASEYDRITVL